MRRSDASFDFATEPRGAAYESLLQAALTVCQSALLVVRNPSWLDQRADELMQRLDHSLVERRERSEWPGTRLLDGTATVYEYAYGDDVATVLLAAVPGLYGWQPPMPEDLCLLREDGTPWLVTIAHEHDGYLCGPRGEIQAMIERWPNLADVLTRSHPIEVEGLVPEVEIQGVDDEDTRGLRELVARARTYVGGFDWCRSVADAWLGLGVAGIFAVVLVRIEPARAGVDEWLWIVVGDLPPLYLVTDDAPNPACALDAYIGEAARWVAAVRAGEPVEELMPVNVPATREWADELDSRLRFLDREVLAEHEDDLRGS